MSTTDTSSVTGLVEPGFEGVRAAFAANFAAGHEVGAALCIHVKGRKVVDLCGGSFDREGTRPYGPDALQLVFSSTKGATAACANLLAQRGLLALDAPVADYWPEFARADKVALPVRFLLSHQAGLPAIDRALTPQEVQAWDPVIEALAAEAPFWEPGTAHGYHALTYGYLVGEVVRRISGRSLGTFFAEEVAGPLGLEFFIGLPAALEPRVSPVVAAPIGGAAQGGEGYASTLLARRPQHGRCVPGPGLDEPPRLARRRGSGRKRHHERHLTVTAIRRAGGHGGRGAIGTPLDTRADRRRPHRPDLRRGPGLRLRGLPAQGEDRSRVLARQPGGPLGRPGLLRSWRGGRLLRLRRPRERCRPWAT